MSSVFDIIGPIMIGPSSSHTAGAARLGKMARYIFRAEPTHVTLKLYGSFAKTYKGHGTNKALIAGLLGFEADSEMITAAFAVAQERGLTYEFVECETDMGHPNVVTFIMEAPGAKPMSVTGRSLGGGLILITDIDGLAVEVRGTEHTLMTFHQDRPGIISNVTRILAFEKINISSMQVFRKEKNADAVMLIHTDQPIEDRVLEAIRNTPCIMDVMSFEPL